MVHADGRTHTRHTSDPSFDGATGERRAPSGPCVRSVVRQYGFFDGTGYGFISTDDGDLDEDVSFHMEDVGGEGLTEGTDVEFDIESSPEGPAWRTSFDSNTGIHLSLTLTNTDPDFLFLCRSLHPPWTQRSRDAARLVGPPERKAFWGRLQTPQA
jgi:CspA family cold shock protein